MRILPFIIALLLPSFLIAQSKAATVSGQLQDQNLQTPLPFVSVVLRQAADSSFVMGVISDDKGLFTFEKVAPNNYLLVAKFAGYLALEKTIYVGSTADFLDLGTYFLQPAVRQLDEITVTGRADEVGSKMEKKTFSMEDNITQSGGSVLQALENLPGITIENNKVKLRGSDQIIVLIDGKQSALTGLGSQSGLDNLPASSIERIEIINNPSAKYDANGHAGIINIILKKEKKDGLHGKVGLAGGVGSLWVRQANLPTLTPQYQNTPKLNPSLSLNYRKNKVAAFVQIDDLYTQTLNKNEFVTRTYDDGTIIEQQTKRNRNTHYLNTKIGLDWQQSEKNLFTVSGVFGSEKILDHGEQVFFNENLSQRKRLWQFLEDELKTTVVGNLGYHRSFTVPGKSLQANLLYTFHRENEQYFFDNILPKYQGRDAFKLLSDEHVLDFTTDYVQPLKIGQLQSGAKLRYREIPTNMQFFPSSQSPLDTNAGGKATYAEVIPALYSTYLFENKKWEGELGLRVEYVNLNYLVDPTHNTYKSDGYQYFQPFPNVRLGYKFNENNRLAFFLNRRVDRPNEVDIRVFPKYDDAEIIKVGNPSLKPQYTQSAEVGYKFRWKKGYWYTSVYDQWANGTITRISTIVDSSQLIYSIFQNAGKSNKYGFEMVFSHDPSDWFSYNVSVNLYHNTVDAFSVNNLYPIPHSFSAPKQTLQSGNVKMNTFFHLPKKWDLQVTGYYIAPDLLPQGKVGSSLAVNFGVKKAVQKGKGQLFINATDIFNTLNTFKNIYGNGFQYLSREYAETQTIRLGYSYQF